MAYVIDQWNCSGCHRCRMECPADAIRFKNDKYWIDPEKCVFCGSCQQVCHNGAISNPDIEQKKPAAHATITMECDVCVIGAGGAGMVAATVSVAGMIGFVGLVVPHIARLMVGSNYKSMLPVSIVLGAVVLLAADTVGRTIVPGMEIPVGIIMAVCGGPFFLYMLRKGSKSSGS